MHFETAREGFRARQQALLKTNEGQSPHALAGRTELGVAREKARHVELQRLGIGWQLGSHSVLSR